MCVEGGVSTGEEERADGRYTYSLVLFSFPQKLDFRGLFEILFGRVAMESKVEMVERGITHTNVKCYIK